MPFVDPAWVVKLMVDLEPSSPYRETFESTAVAIAKAANSSPLPGQNEEKTAATLVSTAWFESRFRQDAEGDCIDKHGLAVESVSGRCPVGTTPRSFCLMQIGQSNFKGLNTTREAVQSSIDVCVNTSLRMMHQSFRTCSSRTLIDRLAHYAGGGPVCPSNEDAVKKSKHRMLKAVWLFGHLPPRTPVERFPRAPRGISPLDLESRS